MFLIEFYENTNIVIKHLRKIVFAIDVAGSICTVPVANLDFTNAIPRDAGGVLRALHTITIT